MCAHEFCTASQILSTKFRSAGDFQYLLTHFLTPWRTVLLEKLAGSKLVKKFPVFYGTRRFITIFISGRNLYLSWARSIQSMPLHSSSWRSILILSPRLGFPSGLFPSDLLTETLYTPLLSPYVLHVPPFSFFSIWSPEKYWVRSIDQQVTHYVVFFPLPFISSLLGPNILLNILCSNTLSLRTSLNVSDQVSHPYKTTGKIIVLCLNI